MKIRNKLLFCAALFATSLTACNNTAPKSTEPEPDNTHVDVFVLSGQSNMEGSTYWTHPTKKTPLLENYFNEQGMDFTPVKEGIPSVKTSFYGFYYPNGWNQAHTASPDTSSPEARLTPNFQPTKVGMGVGDKGDNPNPFFGPELGIANTIAEYASEENPVHLIKCAFSGSGFTKTDGANWNNRQEDPKKSLFYLLKTYTQKCLDAIAETGKVPVLKGFIWHQGESDGGEAKYEQYMRTLLGDFKEAFKSYAVDEDPANIAFLDATIYDGKGKSTLNYGTAANKAKFAIANESEEDLNFIVNGNHEEGGLGLEIGDDAKGGYNTYHYNTPDAYKLGEAYGKIIVENHLLRDK
ncbi:MAG: hypothetical protein J6N95_00225 [Bacilli bacterium]|nr:hypothetical protein [Bacilli bacterium]